VLHAGTVPTTDLTVWDFRVSGLELLATDRPGFWERYGYHTNADHWNESDTAFEPESLEWG
jgi:DMSO/TMAO reductase YedYZ molybdopterin-dependent catalytic subunit